MIMSRRSLDRNVRSGCAAMVFIVSLAGSALAQQQGSPAANPVVVSSPVAAPVNPANEADMMKQMLELSKLNENHKLLASLVGTWSFDMKFWMNPSAPPEQSKGSATTKPMMDGRYFVTDVTGTVKMPDPSGKMKDVQFKGMGIDAYDNIKKKFVSSWVDNMGTGILLSEGSYDPANKSLTYTTEEEMMPGMKTNVREVIKLTDNNHHVLEWYENRGGQDVKTMEITYTRKGK